MRPIERPGTAGDVARRVGSLATRFLVFRYHVSMDPIALSIRSRSLCSFLEYAGRPLCKIEAQALRRIASLFLLGWDGHMELFRGCRSQSQWGIQNIYINETEMLYNTHMF